MLEEERRNTKIKLEKSKTKIDLIIKELYNVKMRLNNIEKLPSHSSIKSNFLKTKLSSSIDSFSTTKNYLFFHRPSCFTCGKEVHKSDNYRHRSKGVWVWRMKGITSKPRGPKTTWIPN